MADVKKPENEQLDINGENPNHPRRRPNPRKPREQVNILPSERGKALKMQLDAIKRQGARDSNGGNGTRSNEVVADRNKMTVNADELVAPVFSCG